MTCEHCAKPVLAHGWCSAHYTRWRRTGDPLGSTPRRAPQRERACAVAGCERAAHSRGWCNAHWKRWRKYGDPLATAERRPCGVEGCERAVLVTRSRSGLCRYHQSRAWKKANPKKVNAANRRYNARKPEVMRASRRRWEEKNPHAKAEVQQTRRARKQACFVEKVYKSKVWRRDEGICGICHRPADPDDWHLDHVVPLALGGEHSYANTQVSHPVCNLRKAAAG